MIEIMLIALVIWRIQRGRQRRRAHTPFVVLTLREAGAWNGRWNVYADDGGGPLYFVPERRDWRTRRGERGERG